MPASKSIPSLFEYVGIHPADSACPRWVSIDGSWTVGSRPRSFSVSRGVPRVRSGPQAISMCYELNDFSCLNPPKEVNQLKLPTGRRPVEIFPIANAMACIDDYIITIWVIA